MKRKRAYFIPTVMVGLALVFVLSLFPAGQAAASGDDYANALKKAKAEDKAVVLYFFSQYCGYCDAMDKDVLTDKEIAATMKNDLVSLRVDADKKPDIARKYGIRGYPTTTLLEPSGKSIIRIPGYVGKKEYRLILDYAKKKLYKTGSLRDYLKKNGVDVG